MEVDERTLTDMISWWREILCLNHWRIIFSVVDDTKLKNALMEVRPTSIRNHAVIFIRRSTIAASSLPELEKLLVHELVHLLFDPLSEEHKLELQYLDCSPSKVKEYRTRFVFVLEKAVEHTAQLLTTHLSFNSLPFIRNSGGMLEIIDESLVGEVLAKDGTTESEYEVLS